LEINSGTNDASLRLVSTDPYVDIKMSDDTTTDDGVRISNKGDDLLLQRTGGNVGIGTTSPDKPLEIAQSDGTSGIRLNYIPSAYPNNYLADIYHDGANGLILESKLGSATIAGDILLAPNGGNIGIGTTSPYGLLELSSAGDTILSITAANNKSSAIHFNDSDAQNQGIISYTHTSDSLRFFTTNTERMRIDSNGVGIGTTSPSATLDIQGTAKLNGADLATVDQLGGGGIWAENTSGAYYNGNVGIGTTSPQVIHHISTENDDTDYAVTRFKSDNKSFDVGVGGSNVPIEGLRNKF
jgi:hypothetical protein